MFYSATPVRENCAITVIEVKVAELLKGGAKESIIGRTLRKTFSIEKPEGDSFSSFDKANGRKGEQCIDVKVSDTTMLTTATMLATELDLFTIFR